MRWTTFILTGLATPLALACGGSGSALTGDGLGGQAAPPVVTAGASPGVAGSSAFAGSPGATQAAPGAGAAGAAGALATPPAAIGGAAAPAAPSGAAPGAPGAGTPPTTAPSTTIDEGCLTCKIPKDCQGMPLEGMQYSPGGTTLPSKCRPFHPTTNNPYAVRCIDAMPSWKTKFPGDEYCILPPPPDKGIQVGPHPHGRSADYWKQMWAGDMSGYDNPTEEFVLESGAELTQNYRSADAPNMMEMQYYRTYFRMRTGSHHMIVTLHESGEADGWLPGVGEALPGMFDPASGATLGILGGEQRPDDSTPFSLEKPPEDEGLYLVWPANPSIIFNMHHFNTTDGQLLREGWINIWWEEDARTRVSWYMGLEFGQTIGLSVSPNETKDYHYSWNVANDTRLVRVFGHRHFWTTNFSAWIKRADGRNEIAYQSFDWFDMPTYRYDSVVTNPPVNPEGRTDGAMSGIVNLKQGDELHFNCHIEFTDKRKSEDPKAPTPAQIGTLRFANEAYNGEMCINFGNVVGSLGLPAVNNSALPDFATTSRTGGTAAGASPEP
ncbi:MAG: hypothetical protein ABW321_23060 [Polyangiales bacterium]